MLVRSMFVAAVVSAVFGQDVLVTVKTKDGDSIKGKVQLSSVKFKKGSSEMTIEIEKVKSIEFGTTDTITTAEDSKLKGKVILDELSIKSDVGEMKLKHDDLVSITVEGGFVKKGDIEDGKASNDVTYHVRVPKKYDAKTGMPAILILHGSNMNSKSYIQTMLKACPKLCEDYILIGINGENRVKDSPDSNPAYNYSYVNWVGKGSSYRGTVGRESPVYVTEALEEIKKNYNITKIFVGGHSQGGFLTYSLFLFFPETFAGAFPMSAGLLVQCDPKGFNDETVRVAQRKRPLAIVHSDSDSVVSFDLSQYAYEAFLDDSFSGIKLFNPKGAGHAFGLFPLEEIVRWLEAMSSESIDTLLDFAGKRIAAKEWRDAVFAINRAKDLDTDKKSDKKIKSVEQKITAECGAKGKAITKLIQAAKDDSWVEQFVAFRNGFEFAESAKETMQAYMKLREEQEKPAKEVFDAAEEAFDKEDKTTGYAKLEEIVKKYYASLYYSRAKKWLKNRK